MLELTEINDDVNVKINSNGILICQTWVNAV